MCNICEITNSSENLLDIFSEEERDKFLRDIYSGIVNNTALDINYYYKVARKLTEGVYSGFGQELIKTQWGTPDYDMLYNLRESVYIFSGAKNYQQTKEISSLLTTEKGLKPFSEFEKDASKVFDTYNRNYLTAEYNSAIAQSRSASLWMEVEREKNIYTQLQYETVGDGRVRPEHAALDNIIRPVDDKFWDTNYPPNSWNCRCVVLQAQDLVNTDLRGKKKVIDDAVHPLFRFNSGKTKQVFNKEHPYFEVSKKDLDFAKNNYNLPLPK
jgi:SPP1 gp7 family putative phage head morphogenesis protein